MESTAAYYLRRYEKLKGDQQTNWQSRWQECADYTIPQNDNIYGGHKAGERKTNRLYDSTSIQSNKLLASALHSMLTNTSSVWFGLSTGDYDLDNEAEVRLWLQDSTRRMINILNATNFQTQIHEVYLNLGAVGTSVLFMGEDKEKVIYFKNDVIYNYVVDESRTGVIDTVMYCEEKTLRELVDEYGKENIPADIMNMGSVSETRTFEVVIIIEPNKDFRVGEPRIETNKPIRTIHILKKMAHVLRESGFNELAHAVPRWNRFSGEKYGRSPAMESMPDIKMLNAMSKVNIRGAQKVVDPPLVVPDSGFALPLDTRPGGTIYKRQGIPDRIEPLVTGARPDIGEEMMNSARNRIRQAYYIDQLQLVQQNNMTATEVMQRTEENLRLMGPILGRLNDELLKPIVERLMGIMFRRKLFKAAPSILKNVDLKVEYVSQIAKAQKTGEAGTLGRVFNAMLPLIQANPQIMDNFDGDASLKYFSDMFGLPEQLFKKPEVVAKQRQQAAQDQEDMMQSQLANQEADTQAKASQAQV